VTKALIRCSMFSSLDLFFHVTKAGGTRPIHYTVYMLVGNGSQSISAMTTLTYAAEHDHSKMEI